MNNQSNIENRTFFSRTFLTVIAVIVIGVLLAAVFHDYYSGHLDTDKQGFAAFAKKELKEHQLYDNGKSSKIYFEYDPDFSLAVRKTNIKQESISEYRDRKIQKIIDSCDKENVRALIIDSADFTSDNGLVSFFIAYREYVVKERKLSFYHSEVRTYLFNGKNEQSIDSVQALRKNYRKPAAAFAPEYFNATYDKKQLNGIYKQYLDDNEDNYNKFIVDGKKFVYMFDEGTVVDGSNGVVSMMVPEMFTQEVLRTRILDRYIDPEKPMVALTYDDGPGGKAEEHILDTLYENGAVATFFFLGNRMSYGAENAARAVKIGCEVGNHSWNHPQYSLMTKKEVKSQISRTNKEIKKYTGVEPVMGRPPYGDYNKETLKAGNIAQVLWTVDTRDWATRNSKKIFNVVKNQKKLDGKIILMHSLYGETAKATEMIIPWLKEKGYQTVTVSELIKYKTGKDPEEGKLYRELD